MKWNNRGHEFDNIGCLLKDKKEVYLYGAGYLGEEMLDVLNKCKKWLNWDIKFVDKNFRKQQDGYQSTQVISPEELFGLNKENIFVIVCANDKNTDDILNKLKENRFELNKNVFTQHYFLYTYLPIHFLYNYNMVFFTSQNIIPSTVCNLNCKNCLNFNPFIKKHIIDDFNSVKEDIDIFFDKVDLIYRFQISGGEPFLNRYLGKLIKYINNNYRNKIIHLETVTNGTIVPSDELCDTLKEGNVRLFLDDYRKALNEGEKKYKEVLDKLNEHKINYIENYAAYWIDLLAIDEKSKPRTDGELELLFNICDNPWSTLRNKKITSCNYCNYAEKAGVCEVDSQNYFDLTTVNEQNKKELIEFRLRFNSRGYVELCKKCAGWTSINPTMVEPAIQVKEL